MHNPTVSWISFFTIIKPSLWENKRQQFSAINVRRVRDRQWLCISAGLDLQEPPQVECLVSPGIYIEIDRLGAVLQSDVYSLGGDTMM